MECCADEKDKQEAEVMLYKQDDDVLQLINQLNNGPVSIEVLWVETD